MARTERAGPPDEKVTINLGPVDLGKIDLLVSEGHFSSRTDLIRDAVRRMLDEQGPAVKEAVVRRDMTVGLVVYGRKDLEAMVRKGKKLRTRVVGMLVLPSDITPELADKAFDEIAVHGILRASKAVKDRLGSRIKKGSPVDSASNGEG